MLFVSGRWVSGLLVAPCKSPHGTTWAGAQQDRAWGRKHARRDSSPKFRMKFNAWEFASCCERQSEQSEACQALVQLVRLTRGPNSGFGHEAAQRVISRGLVYSLPPLYEEFIKETASWLAVAEVRAKGGFKG
jgi:hypothetical protein